MQLVAAGCKQNLAGRRTTPAAGPAIAFRAPSLMLPAASARRLMTEIESPCNKVCTLDASSALCVGCGRSLAEIAGWISFCAEERARIMAELPGRLAALRRNDASRAGPA
jgi:predicted Fe-S protein YdhL (DUF1289 family)